MILLAVSLFTFSVRAQTPELATQPEVNVPTATSTPSAVPAVPTESVAPVKESSDYEVDYEEEPGAEEAEEPIEKPTPVKQKKTKGKKNPKESVLQGSRAEKKIAPLLKSETKSIYKKNGRALDVDSD